MSSSTYEMSAQLIVDIQKLQGIELDLFNNLENGIANKTLSTDDQNKLIEQINKVSEMRVTLHKSLDEMYTYYEGTSSELSVILGEQISTLSIVEKELTQAKIRLREIEEEKNNKLRLVEINTYYGQRYENHTDIMKIVFYICIPIIIVTLIFNAGFISSNIYGLIFGIIVIIGGIFLGRKIYDSMKRDKMNFQEYDFGDIPVNVDKSDPSGNFPWDGIGFTCVGQDCCDTGYTWCPAPVNMCKSNSSLPDGVLPYIPPKQDANSMSFFDQITYDPTRANTHFDIKKDVIDQSYIKGGNWTLGDTVKNTRKYASNFVYGTSFTPQGP